MKIAITGHQLDVGDALRGHVTDVLEEGVSKYFADSMEAHVTFSREGAGWHTHISVHVGHDLHTEGRASGDDAYASFKLAEEHVEKQLRRSKRKLRDHH
ncbi:MAG: ribosome-associated translation inhibitor RaiA [Rhodospirillaceae bacterium]|nr:ribosome-associated translation inhibitor RaiA [Rhodospirillaceae bacterium]MBT6206058.1 ribosome-associated translation inhibitor RaiA [Rhodospirillaceae bacterium]MBT6511542.1 ribosome-associated translation inhibitor RaiA [Rhodospirillaceae bacterium]MBT7614214.1 ribosome-associated translation inhibitor RaiA [Rhodospirillaceae bacterium]MBT7646050.1 ribosome-associated translation inhibitor RaiA [Rhodospirillaceae bacterium]